MLTDVRTAVSSYKWSPDGQWIAYTAIDPITPEEEKAAREKTDVRVIDEDTRMERLYVARARQDADGSHEARLLTPGNYCVAPDYDWSPDSGHMVFTSVPSTRPGVWIYADLSVVDVMNGDIRSLAHTGASERYPMYSPDGRWISYLLSDDPPVANGRNGVAIIPADGGTPRRLAPSSDEFGYLPNGSPFIGWSEQGDRIYYLEYSGTRTQIWALPVNGGPPQEISHGDGVFERMSLNATRTYMGFRWESTRKAPEAYISRIDNFAPNQISHVNQGFDDLPAIRTDVIQWKSVDGLPIEGMLTYPVSYERGKRYPLIVLVHGGPQGAVHQVFDGTPTVGSPTYGPVAALASRGYAILRPNVRGSTGYGLRFRRANHQDLGGMDYKDLIAGVDHVISIGVADPDHMGIGGWSYGGFLTASAITKTQRFRAATIGDGMTDLVSFFGTTDLPVMVRTDYGGEVWEEFELLVRQSPVRYAANVKTPVLILHGERDERVPIGQAQEFYRALKSRGVTVRMVVYPRAGHSPREPKQLVDAMNRIVQWLDQYVR